LAAAVRRKEQCAGPRGRPENALSSRMRCRQRRMSSPTASAGPRRALNEVSGVARS
jgi:hypothetical protein